MLHYNPTSAYDAKILLKNLEKNFTNREKQVLKLLLHGYRIKEISKKLKLDYKTVDNTMQSIKRKIKK